MNNNFSLDVVPGVPNNTTVLFEDTTVLNQALTITLGALSILSVVALFCAGLFLSVALVYTIVDKLTWKNRKNRAAEAAAVTLVNGLIYGFIFAGTSLHDGFDREFSFLASVWHGWRSGAS